ncbi:hypothetical protein COCON_G00187300 [Conger conger]|uniref:BPTI/Kunitz inhibitor domain-containing protein n=1 Tax=Conger conger TaxID=82655 RepID=A0A9Q1HR58_CONCO|nr:kunitz-type protease inhibitor 2 [Conger conger]KAJ8256578.1 hypothetical protein COCON_G00187300 [Conger conger]
MTQLWYIGVLCVLISSSVRGQLTETKTTSSEAEDIDVVSTDACTAPMVVGLCRAALPRFYYDGTSCQRFDYGGCGGNDNNFETIEACNATCKGTSGGVMSNEPPSAPASRKRMAPAEHDAGSPDVSLREMTAEDFAVRCLAEAKTGLCRAAIPRFFFNGTAATCQSFIFGGCGGNHNNYGSVEECQASCLVTVIPSPRKAPEGTSAPPADCTAKFETGPCRAAFPSFYYDPSTQSCQPFIYGGCGGNDNRFSSEEDCVTRCSGQEGTTGKHGTRSNRTPAYVTVGTLVVFSAVALAGLLLVMLRKSKFHRRRRDDKEELLPEDQLTTEQSA